MVPFLGPSLVPGILAVTCQEGDPYRQDGASLTQPAMPLLLSNKELENTSEFLTQPPPSHSACHPTRQPGKLELAMFHVSHRTLGISKQIPKLLAVVLSEKVSELQGQVWPKS